MPSYGVPYGNVNGCSEAPDACIGAAYYNWGPAYLDVVQRVADGTWSQEWLWWEPKWDEIGDDGFYTDADYSVAGFVFGDALSMETRESLKSLRPGNPRLPDRPHARRRDVPVAGTAELAGWRGAGG